MWGDDANLGNGYAYAGGRAQGGVDPIGRTATVKSSKSNGSERLGGQSGVGAEQPLSAGDPVPGIDVFLDQSPGSTILSMSGVKCPPRCPITLLPKSIGDALDKYHLPRVIPAGLGPPCPPGISIDEEGMPSKMVQKQKHDAAMAAIQNTR